MNLKATLFGIFSATLFALAIWLVILFNVNPDQADILTYAALLSSLFIWLGGVSTLIGYYARIHASQGEVVYAHFPIAARQGVLIGLTAVTLLTLQLFRVLNVFDGALIIIIIAISELYFRARTHHA